MSDFTVTIERIGARGDGVAMHQGRAIFLPFTAPGDVVRVRDARGDVEVIERIADGPRRDPPCPHFGACGGCALQHLPDDIYAGAKTALVREALAHRGLDPTIVAPLERVAPATRRRARLTIAKDAKGSVAVGFHARASHRVIDLVTCLVLHSRLLTLLPALRELGAQILAPRDHAAVALTLADTGIDLVLDLPCVPDLSVNEALAAFAERHDLARLSWRHGREAPTPVVQRRPVRLGLSGVAVDLSPDCFLQASVEAEDMLRRHVIDGIGQAARVADLFCGIGTFTFALAATARVHAADGDGDAIAALTAAARRAGVSDHVTVAHRDLERRPLMAEELDGFDAVVFDPPYAGAKAQAAALTRSRVPRVVAVSCHPASFARDARLLVDGGYRLTRVVPVDQFVWSAEIELVAWFAR